MPQRTASLGEIFVVDDDPAVRDVLAVLFSRKGYEVACFGEGTSLLAQIRTKSPNCIILDVHIPGKSGLDILKELVARNCFAPTLVMSGKGDIAMAVEAIKNGALDFIEKPFRGADLVSRVAEVIAAEQQRTSDRAKKIAYFYFPGREPLTSREQEVLSQLVTGATNKEAAKFLGISHRTVELHRASIMQKLGAKSATDLITIALCENCSQ
jgi:FixJ family two-component response regulator